MFKKLKERIYNKKTRQQWEDIMFDNFNYCGDSEFAMFVKKGTKDTPHRFFLPQTDEMFKMAFGKLKDQFYKYYVLDDVKNKIRVYMAHFNISEDAYEYCVNMFINKSAIVNDTNNASIVK